MDVAAFVDKWKKSKRTERSAAHEHFLDLCELFGHPKPGEVDPQGKTFTAELKVKKASGGLGYADYFKKDFFAWEYKSRGKDLNEAFDQLFQYSGDLSNPPLYVACDMNVIEVRTHFTGFPTDAYRFTLDDFVKPANLDTLRRVFFDPNSLRPEKTIEKITEEAADEVSAIVKRIRELEKLNPARPPTDPVQLARFLDRVVFCMFAEDIGILPGRIFSQILEKHDPRPAKDITNDIGQLFLAMARGGDFWGETIPHFNGKLFDDTPPVALSPQDYEILVKAARRDWSAMDPSIFGTLFERVMNPDERSQLGAHYTGFSDIERLVNPIVIAPLRREWEECRTRVESLVPPPSELGTAPSLFPPAEPSRKTEAKALIDGFLKRLRSVRVLDPACGSGNFLYVSLKKMKDLEYEVLVFSRRHDLPTFLLEVGPHQLHGIETNPYSHDLAQMTVWIGFLQWLRSNGFPYDHDPILQPLDTIQHKDAILDLRVPGLPAEPDWPEADFIVGNPPFLGGKKMRSELGDEYVNRLFGLWREEVRPEADLCCYWFEKARRQIELGKCKRAGLLATQGIRGGANRVSLQRIKKTGDIFFAESDRPWVLDGANVHVSMVGFDDGSEKIKVLDCQVVPFINSNLTAVADITQARRLKANLNIGFMGDTKGGRFDIPEHEAIRLLSKPNPHGWPNSDVIFPWINGLDVTRRNRDMWIIDFEVSRALTEAELYELPFEHVRTNVLPDRLQNKRQAYRERWWIHVEPRPAMRNAFAQLPRFLVTPRVAKHRLFVWIEAPTLPDCQLIAFARSDDYFFGILHSRIHEVWSLKLGTRLETRPRYTPTTCFETFPFPEASAAQTETIAQAAKRLEDLRSKRMNPPEWHREEVLEFPGRVVGPWGRFVHEPDARGVGTVRYPRPIPKREFVYDLKKKTLTDLYNKPPDWLQRAHRELDEAVFAAYGWNPSMTDEEVLAALLELNLERSEGGEPEPLEEADGEGTEEAG